MKMTGSITTPDQTTVGDKSIASSPHTGTQERSYPASENYSYRERTTEADIEALARKLHTPAGGDLDPQSPTFDARLWVKSIIDLWNSDPSTRSKRNLGVAFSDLTVSGHGSTTPKYQATTGGIFLDAITTVTRYFSGARIQRHTSILRDFEGVINDGELLLVLGPPGSGCSTLLKTIAGETTGLNVSPETKMNFRGKC